MGRRPQVRLLADGMSTSPPKAVGDAEEKNPISEMATSKEDREDGVEGPNILMKESFYQNDDEDEYWTQEPTGRQLRFVDQGYDGEPKKELVEAEVVIEQVYYSRHNVELDIKSAICCCVTA